MLAFSNIIDFLLNLLRDEDARAQFEHDPQGTLANAGLQGVTGQDIRDARLQLADSGAMNAVDHHTQPAHPHGTNPVHEIGYTTAHYTAAHDAPHDPVVHNDTFLTVDDRDTFFQSISNNDLTVNDNSVAVTDSFNQDNSKVTAIQANDSSTTTTTVNATDSFNSDDDVVAIQDNDVNSGGDPITVDTGAAPVDTVPLDHLTAPAPDLAAPDLAAPDLAVPALAAEPAPEPEPEPEPEPDPEPVDDTPADDPVDAVPA